MVEKVLLDYVEQVYMLESERYTLEKIIEELKSVNERHRLQLENRKKDYNYYSGMYDKGAGNGEGMVAILAICVGIFIGIIGIVAWDSAFANKCLAIVLLYVALWLISYAVEFWKKMKKKKEKMEEVSVRIANLGTECTGIEIVISNLEKEINDYEKLEVEKNKVLHYVYEPNIIHKNYRNFYGISKIYYLLDTGICDTLTGVDGAYSQMRMDQIIDNQKISIELQKELLTTNQMMYSAINRTNNLLEGINTQIDKLNANNKSLTGLLKDNLEVSNFLAQSYS